ncbi:neurotrypsin-like [Argopecten irradians]|uniref:neurotrypsin-like n=1 Tax=Argopecten irradians TaxID=31199 RepID=UPI00372133D4
MFLVILCVFTLIHAPIFTLATSVRLRGTDSTAYRGRVEVLYNGTWGTVCDDFWTDDDASVICRMLNFRKGGTAFSSAHFGEGSGQIWLDNVNCTLGYTVTDISNCHHLSWGTNNCGHNEDAGVTCTFVDIRLVNRTDHSDQVTGRVEVYHGNSWGTVCDDGWTSDNSRVVCRQLGYRDQLNYYGNAVYGQGKGPILMDDVSCLQPFPERIWNCSFNGWGSNNCGHSEDIAVSCAKNEIRLVNGHGSSTGGWKSYKTVHGELFVMTTSATKKQELFVKLLVLNRKL